MSMRKREWRAPRRQGDGYVGLLVALRDWARAGVAAGFTGRSGGLSDPPFDGLNIGLQVSDDPAAVLANRRLVAQSLGVPVERFVFAKQVHGRGVAIVGGEDAGRGLLAHADAIGEVDALVTTARGVALVVQAADCVPVLLSDSEAGVIAAAHAGWRGATEGIVPAAVETMISLGARPERIRAALGPAIRGCCYEVDTPVVRAVRAAYDRLETPKHDALVATRRRLGRAMLDLPTLCRDQLLRSGVESRFILDASICVSCMPGYFSHRKDRGRTGRQGGFIALL